ncbi:hypothetical protein [Nonomuraea sp. bgisy101]|uniref:hypothetical protein n=1 Tax=Nonomuraea sp. bgisy101 TaxID=3413784 RepID=UPI003D730232
MIARLLERLSNVRGSGIDRKYIRNCALSTFPAGIFGGGLSQDFADAAHITKYGGVDS